MKRPFLCISMLFLFIFFLNPAPSHAEEIHSSESKITVLPAKFELTSSRGQEASQSLKIINDSDSDYLYAISIDNISTTGENGEVSIGDNEGNLSNLLASWITLSKNSGTLKAKSTEYLEFSFTIPENAEPGGKYASIVISSDKVLRSPGESKATAKVVSLLMLTVAGDYEENAKILSFSVSSNSLNEYSFVTRIRNQSIAHQKPTGTIVVNNIFGKKIDEIAFEGDNVLPGSTRKTEIKWVPKQTLFGFYNATLVATYGKNKDLTVSAAQPFSNFPVLFTTIMAVLFAIIVLVIALAILKAKRRN